MLKRFIFGLLLITCGLARAEVPTTEPAPLTKEQLIAMVRASQEKVQTIDFVTTSELRKVLNDPVRGTDKFLRKAAIRIKYSGAMAFVSSHGWLDTSVKEPQLGSVVAYDGQRTKSYVPGAHQGTIKDDRDFWAWAHNDIYEILMWPTRAPPWENAAEERIRRITSDLAELLSIPTARLLPEREMLFGGEVVVAEVNEGALRLWIDLKHDAMIRKQEFRRGPGGEIDMRFEVPEIQQAGGVYFPAIARKELYAAPGNSPDLMGKVVAELVCTVPHESLHINQRLTARDFNVEFPPDTLVRDETANASFTAVQAEARPQSRAGQATTGPSGEVLKPAASGPAILSVDGAVDTEEAGALITGTNALVSLQRIEFTVTQQSISANVLFDFVGADADAHATFTLQLLTKDKHAVSTESVVVKKELPPEIPEEHGGAKWYRITSPRSANIRFRNLPIATKDIISYHLEVSGK